MHQFRITSSSAARLFKTCGVRPHSNGTGPVDYAESIDWCSVTVHGPEETATVKKFYGGEISLAKTNFKSGTEEVTTLRGDGDLRITSQEIHDGRPVGLKTNLVVHRPEETAADLSDNVQLVLQDIRELMRPYDPRPRKPTIAII